MPKYAANITMMWTDIEDPFDRLRAASGAGFSAVERVFVDDIDVVEMHKVLDDLGLQLVLFDPYPGKWDEGDRGMLCIPDRHDEMIETVKAAVEHAHILGTPRTNVLAGVLQPGQTRADAYDAARRGLERILEDVDLGGTTILLESVCDDIWNGSLLDTVELAAHLVREMRDPRIRLQLDAYHAARGGVDIMKALNRHLEISGHIQIADHPGRRQPGTGGLPLMDFLARLDELGYSGHVGLEYLPKGTIEESLAWLPVAERR